IASKRTSVVKKRVHLDTALGGEDLAKHSPMLRQRLRVRLRPELVQQARRTLDVSEQEGHGRARELAWHARMIAARGSLVHSQLPTEAATAGHLVGYARPPPAGELELSPASPDAWIAACDGRLEPADCTPTA